MTQTSEYLYCAIRNKPGSEDGKVWGLVDFPTGWVDLS
jgi:hypothetical protein